MSKWNGENFHSISKISLQYRDSSSNTARIYGNGRNQVAISVSVTILVTDPQDPSKIKYLDIDPKEIEDLIYFVNSSDGGDLEDKLDFSNIPMDYVKPISYSQLSNLSEEVLEEKNTSIKPREGEIYIYKYLSSNDSILEKRFSVGINIPNVGKFDTSDNGTGTLNNGSVFKSPKSLNIIAQHPIDYNDRNNIEVENHWEDLSSFHKEDSKVVIYKNYKDRHDYVGVSSVNYIKIKLKNNFRFKKKNVTRNKAMIPNMMTLYGYKTDYEGKEVFGENGSADIIRSLAYKEFHETCLVFIENPKCGVCYTEDSSIKIAGNGIRTKHRDGSKYYYQINKSDLNRHVYPNGKFPFPEISDFYILVVMCNHRTPFPGLSKNDWENKPENATSYIEIFDDFGNKGIIKISLNDNNWPKINVN